jgi:WD40 repeat protein
VAVSPGGDQIASASADGTVIIWDSQSWDTVVVLRGHRGSSCSGGVYAVAWNPAGDRLASCASDKLIVVWDAVSWTHIQTLKGHVDSVRDLVWSGSDLISCSFDQSIRIWDTAAWRQKKIFLWHSPLKCITMSPDGKSLASGSLDAAVVVWHLETSTLVSLVGHEADVSGIAWRPVSGQLASCSWDGLIILWQASTGEKLANFVAKMGSIPNAPLRGLSWNADGSRISSCRGSVVHVWDVPWQNFDQTAPAVTGHTSSVRFLHWNGAKLCSCSEDGTSKIWNASKGLEVATLRRQGGRVVSVSWSVEGDKLAACSEDRTCTIWDAVSFSLIHTLRESDAPNVQDDDQADEGSGDYHSASAKCIAGSCTWIGGRIAASLQSRKILIWDAVSGTCTATIKGHSGTVNSICFCASRSLLASGSDDSNIRVWSVLSHAHQATLKGHGSGICQVKWTTKGDKLASASLDETVILWDCHGWQPLTSLKGHTGIVWTVAFCPAGDQVVSGGFDGVINVWDVHTHEALATFRGWQTGVSCVEFSPLGKELASAYGDGSIVIFDRRVVVNSGTGSAAAMDVETDMARTATAKSESPPYEEHVITQRPPPAAASASGSVIQPQACPMEVITSHQRRAINEGERAGLSSGTLASLVVHCEELSAEETPSLVSLLPANTSLTSLALYRLQAGHEGQLVPDGIRMLTQLTSLHITNSSVDFEAACLVRGVTNVLHSTVSLQHLDLERNSFGPSGATGLAEALSWLASLRGLRLGYNALQDAGGHEIAKAVSRLSSLSELGLESNSFTPAGVSKIAEDLAFLPDLVIVLQDASLTSDYVDSMPPSRHEGCSVGMTVLPSCLVEAFEPAGVPGMRFKHGIRGNMPHTLAVTFDMEALDLDAGLSWWRQRLWLAWFGAPGVGSAHWIMNDRFCDIDSLFM